MHSLRVIKNKINIIYLTHSWIPQTAVIDISHTTAVAAKKQNNKIPQTKTLNKCVRNWSVSCKIQSYVNSSSESNQKS